MGTMTLAITGANGFLGQACVAAALAHGHRVRALVRRDEPALPEAVDVIHCDLAEGVPAEALIGVDAVIHIAAAMSNDPAFLARDTTQATTSLIEAILRDAGSARLVLAGSISVYDAYGAQDSSSIDEDAPLETDLARREGYMRAKLVQEIQAQEANLPVWALRIGALYGPGRNWNAHIGPVFGPVLVSLSRRGSVPLCHVENAAEALVLAAETTPQHRFEALNIVDDNLPSRAAFIRHAHRGPHLPFSWRVLMPFAVLVEGVLGARAPGLLRPRVLAARMRPASYPNHRAKTRLGWEPVSRFGNSAERVK